MTVTMNNDKLCDVKCDARENRRFGGISRLLHHCETNQRPMNGVRSK
jgi:hypothetical protein